MFKLELIFRLSLFGLLMGLATIWFIPYQYEIYFWVIIFLYCGYCIGKIHRGNWFLHGVFVTTLSGLWYSLAHVFFYHQYMGYHPEEFMMLKRLGLDSNPKGAMLVTGPMFGAIFGILQGGIAVGAHLLRKRKKKSKR